MNKYKQIFIIYIFNRYMAFTLSIYISYISHRYLFNMLINVEHFIYVQIYLTTERKCTII